MPAKTSEFWRVFLGEIMTKEQQDKYASADQLRKFVQELKGKKFKLDCGHHVTFGHFFGNDIMIRNGAEPQIICSLCGY